MNVVRYEPWGLLRRFHDDVNQLFGEGRVGSAADGDRSSIVTSNWTPAVDIKDGVLTIKGERKHESEEEANGYKRVERSYGSFYRRFSLPDTANAEGVTAQGKDGVLEVVIPKHEKVQPRRITVS
jgi:HSP20 family protein